jgi:hypothetical protein
MGLSPQKRELSEKKKKKKRTINVLFFALMVGSFCKRNGGYK